MFIVIRYHRYLLMYPYYLIATPASFPKFRFMNHINCPLFKIERNARMCDTSDLCI